MSFHSITDDLSISAQERIDVVCNRWEAARQNGENPDIHAYLIGFETSERARLLRELILMDLEYRRGEGEDLSPEEHEARYFAGRFDGLAPYPEVHLVELRSRAD